MDEWQRVEGRRFGRIRPARSLALLAGSCACISTLVPSRAIAQDVPAPAGDAPGATSPVRAPAVQRKDLSGRDFGGVRLSESGGAVQRIDLNMSARKAALWSESGTAGAAGAGLGGAACERLLLRGDVRVNLGDYRFTAAQASVWIQRLGTVVVDGGGQRQRSQFAICFDRVSDPGAQAGFSQAADRLIVTGIIEGAVSLKADGLVPERPGSGAPGDAFILESEQRFADYLARLLGATETPRRVDVRREPKGAGIEPGQSRPYEPNSTILDAAPAGAAKTAVDAAGSTDALFIDEGTITFAVGTQKAPSTGDAADDQAEIKLVRGGTAPDGTAEDNTLLLSGGIVVQYQDVRQTRNLQITAQRAVVFLTAGPLTDLARFSMKDVKGIYVEGDVVATDGQYTLRGPRVFYDVQQNQALMVDAVFFTYDERLQAPIYVRAKELRQRAANQFSATGARLATTSFFDPVLSVGASEVTITQGPASAAGEGGQVARKSYMDAKGLTLRFADLPFFWFPGYKGEIDSIPLEDLRLENSSGSGTALKTGWNTFGLLGLNKPESLKSRLLLDWYFDRGPALGTRTSWDYPKHEGDLFGYILPDDNGEDVLSSGARRGRDGEVRGLVLAKDRWTLDRNWTLFLEGNYVSDENFVDAFFRRIAANERELTNSAFLRYVGDNSGFTFQAKGTFNDFTVNQYLLTSQGYTVDKLPELAYYRIADDLFSQWKPGLITWTQEYRASRMRLNFTEPTVSELGFNTNARSRAAFGLSPSDTLADSLRAAGLRESEVLRLDTRHELTGNLDLGAAKLTPFVVGRFTTYDDGFQEFNGSDDKDRFFYASGARLSTEITRVYNDAENDTLDIHRLRHIIEPSLTVWYGGSTLNQTELPVYDDRVESLATGATVKAGLAQTLQTQRGGAGRWRSVDWLTLSADIVYSTDDADDETPGATIGRFFDFRPEYSFLGDFATIDASWQLTDSIALSSNYVYDLDFNQPARTSVGGMIQHSPDFSTYAEVRYINELDTTYVDGGVAYELTRRYSTTASVTYDTDVGDIQSVGGTVRRKTRDAVLGFSIRYDNIRSETSFGLVVEPTIGAARDRGVRLREFGR